MGKTLIDNIVLYLEKKLFDTDGYRKSTADAGASVIGATLGTSPVTAYVESAAGVFAGGRTGFTSVIVALCFLCFVIC
jgi:xanthine/uracil/vitamin C permease (AzgA family)